MEAPNRPLYELIGGAPALQRLVDAFYDRVAFDPDLAPIFPSDFTEVKQKQYAFLTQFLGGPPLFSEQYGPPMLRYRHLPHPITPRRAQAWLRCMEAAMEEANLPQPYRGVFFTRLMQTAAHMVNREDEAQ